MKLIVVGGGAAGFFGAIAAAENGHRVTILEASANVLAKVRISGGGRCNVTHACFDPRELVQSYPRGGKALRGPFAKFQPQDTIDWFDQRGVRTKTEADGRMFPTTDDSQTIVDCLQTAARNAGVKVRTKSNVVKVVPTDHEVVPTDHEVVPTDHEVVPTDLLAFQVHLKDEEVLHADRILLATGGTRAGFELATKLGHEIVPPVPSLFTFKISDHRIKDLPGISVENATCKLITKTKTFQQIGPLLVTHWGMSGPAVLKLSAWAARELFEDNYQATLRINWLSNVSSEDARQQLAEFKIANAKKNIETSNPWTNSGQLPKRLWKSFVDHVLVGSNGTYRWAELSKKNLHALATELTAGEFSVTGKGVFKDEFVTCGGVKLSEVDFRSMESRLRPGLFFAGEILDIDGITGGFNFQNAWTTGWIAGQAERS